VSFYILFEFRSPILELAQGRGDSRSSSDVARGCLVSHQNVFSLCI
jgi:hypothetical protein